jgi:integrase
MEGWDLMASLRKRGRVWYFRYTDADGVNRSRKGCTDRRVTEELARAAEAEAAKIRAGLVDAKDLARRDHKTRPLSEHLTAWREAMLNQGHTPKHADQSADRVRRLVAVMSGARPNDIDGKTMSRSRQAEARDTIDRLLAKAKLSDISTEQVQAAIATFRDSGRSDQTCNHYRACARALARWAWKTGRLQDNPLVGLTGYNAKEDRSHDRRTLSLDELTRLIQVTGRGPTFQRMTGLARALCYRLAASTGLRYSEIASITPASFNWNDPSPSYGVARIFS